MQENISALMYKIIVQGERVIAKNGGSESKKTM